MMRRNQPTSKDRIHPDWCTCPACRPLHPGERFSPATMRLVWAVAITGSVCAVGEVALAVLRGAL